MVLHGFRNIGFLSQGAAPNQPNAPTVNNSTRGVLAVSWVAPADNGSTITGYTLQRRLDTGAWSTVYTGTNTSFSDSGVVKGSSYQYQVLATNAFGSSAYSNASISSIVQGVAATGGSTTDVSGYRIHSFANSGTLSFTSGGSIDYLIVGGGGGGGAGQEGIFGSGGGGGRVTSGSASVGANSFSITVGGGGAGAAFGGFSGAGAGSGISGTGLSNSAAGGHAVAPTTNAQPGQGASGSGVAGIASSITGSSIGYGGGGGGAYYNTAGADGGGNGGVPGAVQGGAGTNGRGGGGGGSYNFTNGGSGGSGIVIVRYLL